MFELLKTNYGRVLIKRGGLVRPEVQLHLLEVGSRFRCDNLDGTWTYGTLVDKNRSRCVVVLSGGQQQVVFDDNGRPRRFASEGRSTVSWPLEVTVEDITEAEEDWRPDDRQGPGRGEPTKERRIEDPEERGIHMSTQEAQAKGLNARYKHAVNAKAKAEEEGKADQVEVQTSRIAAIEQEAQEKGITLVDPNAPVEQNTHPDEPAAPKPSKAEEKKAKLAANLKAAAKPKATKGEAKAKKAKSTHDCICGCKRETMGLYAPGHDARVKGILISVERGKLPVADIPEGVKPFVKFTGNWGKEGYKLVEAPVKIPGRDDVANSTQTALEALDV